ncbi:MAG: NAD-glutamate dehydrogenase, partial [Pseudomonadota bacterium]
MADTSLNALSNEDLVASMMEQMKAFSEREQAITFSDEDLNTLATDFLEWARTCETASVRLRPGTGADGKALDTHVLEVTGPDRPFLVDSMLGACTELSLDVQALFHPILGTNRETRRSLIQIHLPPLSEAEQNDLRAEVEATLNDVIAATSDYRAMQERMQDSVDQIRGCPHVIDHQRDEAIAFLEWLGREHFVFLGVRDYSFHRNEAGELLPEEPDMIEGSNLGLLKDENRNVLNRGAEPLVINRDIGEFLSEPEPLILAKATLRSRVHRRVNCDYIGVKSFDDQGRIIGETRYLGLYTSEAYNSSVKNIPLIRKRVNRVIEASGALRGTHNEKALSNIMESWPRDELFQMKAERLTPIMLGALNLIGRPRVKLFVRPDRFGRFISAVVFVPREAYDTSLREQMTEALEDAYEGRLVSFQPSFDGAALVRVLFEIALPHDAPEPDEKELEAKLVRMSRTWNERFRNAIADSDLNPDQRSAASLFHGAFNAAYREMFTPSEALRDVDCLSAINADAPVKLRAYRLDRDTAQNIRAKIYARNGSIALSDCVPVFERMGLFVDFETGYPVKPRGKPVPDAPDTYWVHDLRMRRQDGRDIDMGALTEAFESAFVGIWSGLAENDGFNQLIFNAGLNWRESALMRTLCAYRHQSGLDPAKDTQIEALNTYPKLTRQLVDLFHARLQLGEQDITARKSDLEERASAIESALVDVKSLDHDRVLRRLADLIPAIQRTSYYQTQPSGAPLPYIAVKIASRELDDLPDPKPYREIFMSSPLVDGVHCRFGPVARGGLRWSDRRDDFRTEVLGLVKAQQVKNAVIVPVGSKGGFFPKQLPINGTREEVREAGIAAYRQFITSLLSITDNLVDGDVQPPKETVIWDGEDPYLVVAADKGTATFSDIANEISESHGFWLGDAFASGGSAGYDHKKMGITARGGWEAVKRHFREIGKDIQTEPFTVIGCGDMSGDVFGNGMLLSKQIRLQAAYNHLHIFIDPDPQNLEASWDERKRLFDLPRSSWMDYNQEILSRGGGVFERSAKSIDLTPEIKALTGLKVDKVTPDELIHALLKAECELLWFGGIGTYVKASDETHGDVGDRANDGLRIDGKDLKAKVIGEGANLGLTQAGRIEAAQNGVHLNTDAIDNSAGVDSSDHEVNIKILCTEAIRRGSLPRGERNTLLASMTDQVADKVLAHNYAQTRALTLAEANAMADHEAFERLMVRLEKRGVLNREVEGLPSTAEMDAREENRQPLTRPEIAAIMAWTKIVLFDDLVASDTPDDPHFKDTLKGYFPDALHTYDDAMQAHRLKREIISTVLANRIVDMAGPVFFLRLREQSEANSARLVKAFEAASGLLNARKLQDEIDGLDNQVPAARQTALQDKLASAVGNLTQSLVQTEDLSNVSDLISSLTPMTKAIQDRVPDCLQNFKRGRFEGIVNDLRQDGVPDELALTLAKAGLVVQTPRLSALANETNQDCGDVFAAFQAIGDVLSLDKLRAKASDRISAMPYWDRLATRRLISDMEVQQVAATQHALSKDDV